MPSSLPTVAVPGQPLAPITDYLPGHGIHVRSDGQLCASIVGLVRVSSNPNSNNINNKPSHAESLPILSLSNTPSSPEQEEAEPSQHILPTISSQVLARITRTTPRQAAASILAINDIPTTDDYPAVIRLQDIRATGKDKIKMAKSFKPGDIVRATVISLGDREGYYLSTAGNYLGVVVGWSEEGGLLYPKSWREMVCSKTGIVEERKVAKPL